MKKIRLFLAGLATVGVAMSVLSTSASAQIRRQTLVLDDGTGIFTTLSGTATGMSMSGGLTLGSPLPVGSGGLGITNPTAGALLLGNGTSAVTMLVGTGLNNGIPIWDDATHQWKLSASAVGDLAYQNSSNVTLTDLHFDNTQNHTIDVLQSAASTAGHNLSIAAGAGNGAAGGNLTLASGAGTTAGNVSITGVDVNITGNLKANGASTAGSIVFVGGSNQITEDNGNLFWDRTNHRLGLGTTAPTSLLANTTTNYLFNDGFGDGISPGSMTWRTNGNGFAMSVTNSGTIGDASHHYNGLAVATTDQTAFSIPFNISSGASGSATKLFEVKGNGDVTIAPTSGNVNIGHSGGTTTFTGTVTLPSGAITAGSISLTQNDLMVGDGSSHGSALATANSSVLVTDGTGVPSLSKNLPSGLAVNNATNYGATFQITDGAKAGSGLPFLLSTNDGAGSAMQLSINRTTNTSFDINAIEQGVGYKAININTAGAGPVNIGNGGTFSLNSANIDISTAGAITGATGVSSTTVNASTSTTSPIYYGGSAAGSTLTLQNTTASGTTATASAVTIKVGDNGATTAVDIANNGDIDLSGNVTMQAGKTIEAPTGKLIIQSTSSAGDATLQLGNADGILIEGPVNFQGNTVTGFDPTSITFPSTGAQVTRTIKAADQTGTDIGGDNISLIGGKGSTANGIGGDINISGGAGQGTGHAGDVNITGRNINFTGNVSLPAGSVSAGSISLTQNDLMVGDGSSHGSALATANSSVLVTDGAGVPSLSTQLPKVGIGTAANSFYELKIDGTTGPTSGAYIASKDVNGTSIPFEIDGNTTGMTFNGVAGNTQGRMMRVKDLRDATVWYDMGIDASKNFYLMATDNKAWTFSNTGTTTLPGSLVLTNGANTTTISAPASNVSMTIPTGGWAAAGANSDITSLTGLTTALSVGQGGTGQQTFTAGSLIVGNGTSAMGNVADVAAGSVLVSGGAGSNPSYSATPTLTSVTAPTLIGSTAADGQLTLKATTDNSGTTTVTNTAMTFNVGDNAGTTAMSIKHNGTVNIPTLTVGNLSMPSAGNITFNTGGGYTAFKGQVSYTHADVSATSSGGASDPLDLSANSQIVLRITDNGHTNPIAITAPTASVDGQILYIVNGDADNCTSGLVVAAHSNAMFVWFGAPVNSWVRTN